MSIYVAHSRNSEAVPLVQKFERYGYWLAYAAISLLVPAFILLALAITPDLFSVNITALTALFVVAGLMWVVVLVIVVLRVMIKRSIKQRPDILEVDCVSKKVYKRALRTAGFEPNQDKLFDLQMAHNVTTRNWEATNC